MPADVFGSLPLHAKSKRPSLAGVTNFIYGDTVHHALETNTRVSQALGDVRQGVSNRQEPGQSSLRDENDRMTNDTVKRKEKTRDKVEETVYLAPSHAGIPQSFQPGMMPYPKIGKAAPQLIAHTQIRLEESTAIPPRPKHKQSEAHPICGLCNTGHPPNQCPATQKLDALLEYRRQLLENDQFEPWDDRARGVKAIDAKLAKLGYDPKRLPPMPPDPRSLPVKQGKTVDNHRFTSKDQGVSPNVSLAATSSTQPTASKIEPRIPGAVNVPSALHPTRVPSPVARASTTSKDQSEAVPAKKSSHVMRGATVGDERRSKVPLVQMPAAKEMLESSHNIFKVASSSSKTKKKQETFACPICGGAYHIVKKCPDISTGTDSIKRAIARLADDPRHDYTIKSLNRILKKLERPVEKSPEVIEISD